MKITDDQFTRLLDLYITAQYPENVPAMSYALMNNKVVFQQAIKFLEQEFGENLNLAAISSMSEESAADWDVFFNVMQGCLTYNDADKTFSFNELAAKAIVTSRNIRQQVVRPDNKAFYGNVENLGLLEKYSNNTLGAKKWLRENAQTWLTDLDINRMLDKTGLHNKVNVTFFDAKDIGQKLHFERIAREKNTDPNAIYGVPFILNKGSNHWIAAVITVNPMDRTISYYVEDSMSLSETRKNEIRKIIEQAISYKGEFIVQGVKKTYEAFQGWRVNLAESHVVGAADQKDDYSCGYRALHTLYKSKALAALVNENQKAKAYADCPNDSDSLVKYVYNVLLQFASEEERLQFNEILAQEQLNQKSRSAEALFDSTNLTFLEESETSEIQEEVEPLPDPAKNENVVLEELPMTASNEKVIEPHPELPDKTSLPPEENTTTSSQEIESESLSESTSTKNASFDTVPSTAVQEKINELRNYGEILAKLIGKRPLLSEPITKIEAINNLVNKKDINSEDIKKILENEKDPLLQNRNKFGKGFFTIKSKILGHTNPLRGNRACKSETEWKLVQIYNAFPK